MKIQILTRLLLLAILFVVVSPAQAATERELIQILQSSASAVDKCSACRELRVYGTAQSVPALAALLNQERVGHAARYALEGMDYPEAGAALRKAVTQTSGSLKVGLVDSLGWRRDRAAVPVLKPLLAHEDVTLAVTAASALGRIGSSDALDALNTEGANSNPVVRLAILDAKLNCAEQRLATGDSAGAAIIYGKLYSNQVPSTIRLAAWRGLVMSDSRQRVTLMAKALGGADAPVRSAACKLLRQLKDAKVLKACLKQWDTLGVQAQLAVLETHLLIGPDSRGTVRKAVASNSPTLRIAGWQALTESGDVSLLPALARAATTGDKPEREAAQAALSRIHGPGVRKALLTHLKKAEDAEKAELLRTLGARGDTAAAPVLLEYAENGGKSVRLAALVSLRQMALVETLQPLLDLTVMAKSSTDRSESLKALFAICRSHSDKAGLSRQILGSLKRMPTADRRYVLPLLAELGTPEALKVVLEASQSSDTQLARESIKVMSQWPNMSPVAHLFDMARTHTNSTLRILALRAGIAVVGRGPDASQRLTMMQKALALAQRTDEKRLVLSQLGRIPQAKALELTLPFLDEPALTNEAGLAVISIAESLAKTQPQLADQAAQKVLAACEVQAIVKRAWALRVKPASGGPFIRNWLVCGPYRQSGAVGATTVFNLAFGPEKAGEDVLWYAAPPGDSMPLAAFFPGQHSCVAYLKAELSVPQATDAILLMGSDDGIKAWINGQVVHSNNVDRGQVADQDMAPVKLKKGANELLLKISQGGGGWSACARIVGPDGKPLKGLRVKDQKDAAAPVSAYTPTPVKPVVPKVAKLPPRDKNFRTLRLSELFYTEGAYYGDFNRDGIMDVVAGPFWFVGPYFQQRIEYRPVQAFDPKGYSDNFLTFTGDFNGDDWIDILAVPWPGKEGYWYANPAGREGHWQRHLVHPFIGNESQVWGDVTDDGVPELLFCIEGYLGYAGPNPADPTAPWAFHAVTTKDKRYQRYTHGLGYGDINGDGHTDIVEGVGWWEQPALGVAEGPWTFHAQHFADAAAQILVYDVDGDGLSDVITAWHCHHYGMVWWKQAKDTSGRTFWEQNVILSPAPNIGTTDFRPSQLHALKLIDMNGDGLKDILTGKRFWAHGPTGDKEPDAPAVVFWLELKRDGKGGVSYVPHLIDDNSGVGTQVAATDLTGDGRPDVIVGNKKGIFVHLTE